MTPEEFWRILHDAPEPKPLFYRLYHDEQGMPIVYSMEDLPGNYIEIDQQAYHVHSYDVRVVDGRLVHIERKKAIPKLRPTMAAGITCHPQDVCVIVDEQHEYIKWAK